MAYSPKSPPTITTLSELRDYVEDELQQLAVELESASRVVLLEVVNAAPVKPREGMLVYADGTHFNPGSGRGTYEYRGGAWVKL
jgi:hypothetical protein